MEELDLKRYRINKPCKEKINELKFQVCQAIDREISKQRISQQKAAIFLGTSQGNISRIVRKRVDQLTFNQLFTFLIILNPNTRMLLSPY